MPRHLNAGMLIDPPATLSSPENLVHLSNQSIDVLLTISQVSTLNEMLEFAWTEAAGRVAQLKGPEEVRSLFEIGANSVDFVNQVLDLRQLVKVRRW